MEWLLSVKLIRLFEFYLALCFFVGTLLRWKQYRTILQVARTFPGRWPKLLELIKKHKRVFVTWGMVLPLLCTLMLWAGHALFRRIFLSDNDDLTVESLGRLWWMVPVVAGTGLAMLYWDLRGMLLIQPINSEELEKNFDQAEYWLRSWTAPVVRVFTLGFVNPRKIVTVEVRNALVNVSRLINYSLWWMSIQTLLRIAFGVSLWASFALVT